jgi:membrane protein
LSSHSYDEAVMDVTAPTIAEPAPVRGLRYWKRVALGTLRVFFDPDTSPRCAATAFFGFLSIFPAIATVALIYGLVANRTLVAGTVSSLQYILPNMALDVLGEQLDSLASQQRLTLSAGLLISVPLALWSGSRGVDALLYAMSRVRGEKPKRGIIARTLAAIALSIAGSIFVVVALLTVAGLPALIPFPSGEGLLVLVLRWPALLVLSVGVLAVLYRWGPDRHPRKFRYIWPGALLASLLWLLAGAVFSIYVENFGNYQATFGSVSAAVVLLLWLYNSAQILVLGAAFNAELEYMGTGHPPALAPTGKS